MKKSDKVVRLQAALRENLRKRKEQQRKREAQKPPYHQSDEQESSVYDLKENPITEKPETIC